MSADDSKRDLLVALNADLERMADMFSRLVKAGRVDVDAAGIGTPQFRPAGELVTVLVEGLVSRAYDALERVNALQKIVMMGNSDRILYDKIRKGQHDLRRVSADRGLFALADHRGGLATAQQVLNQLEEHYYRSAVPTKSCPSDSLQPDVIDDICSKALYSGSQDVQQ